MSAEDILRSNEALALDNHQIISTVTEKPKVKGNTKGKKSFSAVIFLTLALIVFLIFFGSGSMIPSAISDRLIEETDVQYADAVQSKALVFQQALKDGDVPANTVSKLKEKDVIVGYLDDGVFHEGDGNQPNSCLKFNGEIILADDFLKEINKDAKLYDVFNQVTYSRAAYYYDDSAKGVFNKLGSSRNNYNNNSSFEEIMNRILGSGSDIEINNVALTQETRQNENNEEETYYIYKTTGDNVNSNNLTVTNIIETISNKTMASSSDQATLGAAESLNTADTISKEQRSSLFYLAFMESISKMKAGEGNQSRVNDAMNFLHKKETTEVVDINTGEIVTIEGSMLEAPSLYAVLSGETIDTKKVENYTSDRVLKTIENQLGTSSSTSSDVVVSSTKGNRGSIGHYLNSYGETASNDVLAKVTPTISSSLVNNSFSDIHGVSGGELLVEGAVNVGKELAKASGATAGDAASAKSYAKLNNTILALDAEVDRANRSPFDITSKNTFLGSLLYKFAISVNYGNGFVKNLASFGHMTTSAIRGLLPVAMADDENDSYLTNFGDCTTLGNIGAVGSATCSTIATFDTSTIDGIFDNPGFISFLNNNTELSSSGTRVIKEGSDLAHFILYNDERVTPVGIVDGGILNSISNNLDNIYYNSDILSLVKLLVGSSDSSKDIASGKSFVNSSSNSDWDKYKYAQRYVSLARATATLRMYDGDETAYSKMKYFEGTENPVIAFLNNHYNNIASNN